MTIGRYQIQGELGRGGMGAVLLGYDPKLKRKVAIKTVRLDGHGDPAIRAELEARLEREAEAAAQLRHPAIVGIHDIIEAESSIHIVMEFIGGKTLSDVYPLSQPVPPVEAVRILKECAAALDYAHARNIVHRDIKPSNIMLDETGGVRIADSGIARIVGAESLSATGMVVGTLEYMCPEQLRAENVDGSADQFSLAMVGYRMLTGRRLYSAITTRSLTVQIATMPPPPAHQVNPSLPAAVDAVLAKALHKERTRRYVTCSEFAASLEIAMRPPVIAIKPPQPTASPTSPSSASKPRRIRATILIAAALAVVALAIFLVITWKEPQSQTLPLPLAPIADELNNPKDDQAYALIPEGKFMMGCSPGDNECADDESWLISKAGVRPPHQVTITKGFRLGRTEVTQAAYERMMGSNPSQFKGADLPVDTVNWTEAKTYCEAVGGRLPTEAEWEYAARGGMTGARYGELESVAWYDGNSGGKTHSVGQKQANGFGLYDVLGNVFEWVEDLYPGTQLRTLRGGSWGNSPRYVRVSFRYRSEPGVRSLDIGFRCAWDHP